MQMVSSCFFLYILRRWRIISFTASESLLISDNSAKFVSLKTLKHTFPLAGAYLLYMVQVFPPLSSQGQDFVFCFFSFVSNFCSPLYSPQLVTMEAVRGVNVPMYTTLRRTTVVFTMLVEFVLVGQRYTHSVIFR